MTDYYFSEDDLQTYVDVLDDYTLEPHGILGQKWGFRRFQNSDGSLTEEGRRRYGVGEKKEGPIAKAINNATKKIENRNSEL